MEILDLNHVALGVSDVPRSIRFYEEIVGLKQKPRPDFDFEGAWFALGETRELHLIEGLDTPVFEDPREVTLRWRSPTSRTAGGISRKREPRSFSSM